LTYPIHLFHVILVQERVM